MVFLFFSALFSPPDIISQIGIAIPLIIFYELSILFIRFFIKKKLAMHDPKFIKENSDFFDGELKKRNFPASSKKNFRDLFLIY